MLGTGLQFTRGRKGDDRFYNAGKARRAHLQEQNNDRLRRAQSDITETNRFVAKEKLEGSRSGSNRTKTNVSASSNLERFLESITPNVTAQHISKTRMRGWKKGEVGCPYFVLEDVWESYKEWSAYGAGVPLILNNTDSVVLYYVPYLSAIQIYLHSNKSLPNSRRPGEDSDSDFRDSSSAGSSDCEAEKGLKCTSELWGQRFMANDIKHRMDRLSFRDQQIAPHEEFSSDEGESMNSLGCLLFEYLERDPPYSRVPLFDKISDLSFCFPELKTLRSCDISPSSWISVAWYPIYRIPTGPTLKDLDACFLTYQSLHTTLEGTPSGQGPLVKCNEMGGVPKMSLPVFGLASYKFKGSLWTPNGGCERQLANSLLQAADNWLRLLEVDHPDFLFFCRR